MMPILKKLGMITLNESLCELLDKKLGGPGRGPYEGSGQGLDGNDVNARRHQVGFQELVRIRVL